ncbi:HAD family hydrolase [Actinomyces oris]|uniref:HAD family hydrolase n=1 Tax=Actinomyces oris TaxID=544580 RepID=UPI002115F31B|nr:HAD hydrolase family protein [Actinomyces oris]
MLSSPVGVVTDLDGTVVFGGVADPRLAPFLRRAAGREDISVIVATSRAPRGMAEVLGDAVTCLEGSVCLNGALLRLGDKERRYPMRADHVRAVVDAAFRAGMPLYVDQGHSFTALAGHDSVAEPRSGEASAAASDFAASPGTTAEKETRRRCSQDSETEPGLWDGLEHMRDYPDGTWCGVPGVSRTRGDFLPVSRHGWRPCQRRSTQRSC